jgi:hypothetical protein
MKKFISTFVLMVVIAGFPSESFALSCMDPAGMIENYVTEPSYVIVTATAGEMKEYVKEKAIANNPNASFNSGYTGQFLDITKAHKGTATDSQWVYFERNGTWNYLCVGEPPKPGTKSLYILNPGDGLFTLQSVAGVYEADSAIAKDIIKALSSSEEEPAVYEVSKADWMERLRDELKNMAFLIEVKLSEWKFWLAQ